MYKNLAFIKTTTYAYLPTPKRPGLARAGASTTEATHRRLLPVAPVYRRRGAVAGAHSRLASGGTSRFSGRLLRL